MTPAAKSWRCPNVLKCEAGSRSQPNHVQLSMGKDSKAPPAAVRPKSVMKVSKAARAELRVRQLHKIPIATWSSPLMKIKQRAPMRTLGSLSRCSFNEPRRRFTSSVNGINPSQNMTQVIHADKNLAQTIAAILAGVVSSDDSVPARRSSEKLRIVSSGKIQSNGSQNNLKVPSTGVHDWGDRLHSNNANQ